MHYLLSLLFDTEFIVLPCFLLEQLEGSFVTHKLIWLSKLKYLSSIYNLTCSEHHLNLVLRRSLFCVVFKPFENCIFKKQKGWKPSHITMWNSVRLRTWLRKSMKMHFKNSESFIFLDMFRWTESSWNDIKLDTLLSFSENKNYYFVNVSIMFSSIYLSSLLQCTFLFKDMQVLSKWNWK